MAIQTTSTAPIGHVTPTMVTPVNSSQLITSASSTPTAAVFLRTSSAPIATRIQSTNVVSSSIPTPSTSTLGVARASSQSGVAPSNEGRGMAKRQREDEEGGASTSAAEPPASKRKKPLVTRLRHRQMEVTASSSPSPDTQGVGQEEMSEDQPSQASESQVNMHVLHVLTLILYDFICFQNNVFSIG